MFYGRNPMFALRLTALSIQQSVAQDMGKGTVQANFLAVIFLSGNYTNYSIHNHFLSKNIIRPASPRA